MRKFLKYFLVTLVDFLLLGCQVNDDRKESKYDLSGETPIIKTFAISEVLKPIDMVLSNNYLCLLHEEESDGEQIYVFDAENLKFLYKFAKRGNGPEETLALDLVKTISGDSIELIDQANYKKLTYILTPGGAEPVRTKYLDLPQLGPLQETYRINDSIMIFNTNNCDLLTYNEQSDTIVDQVNIADLIEDIPTENIKKLGSFNFSIAGKDIFVGLRFFDDIFKIELDDNFKFIRDDNISVSSLGIETEDILDNYGYYSFLNAGNNHVLAQYYGYKLKELQPFPKNLKGRNLKYDLILLDTGLTPLHKYQTNINILRAYLDENRNRIYFWDAMEDFDKLNYIEIGGK